jgi:hypothetical protein
MKAARRLLLVALVINAVTAIGGGIALATGILKMPLVILVHTPFKTFVIPALILACIVGGSSLWALILVIIHGNGSKIIAACAGGIMAGWILAEIVLIRGFSWLHGLYLITGFGTVLLSARSFPKANPPLRQ